MALIRPVERNRRHANIRQLVPALKSVGAGTIKGTVYSGAGGKVSGVKVQVLGGFWFVRIEPRTGGDSDKFVDIRHGGQESVIVLLNRNDESVSLEVQQ